VAFILARVYLPGKAVLTTLAILPLVSPPFIGAYSVDFLFGARGYVTSFFQTHRHHHTTVKRDARDRFGIDAQSVSVRPLDGDGGPARAGSIAGEEAAQGLGSSPWASSGL